jgi:hypothetical protein
MTVKTELTWKYQPTDFFEGPLIVTLESGELVAAAGDVTLTLATPSNHLTSILLGAAS